MLALEARSGPPHRSTTCLAFPVPDSTESSPVAGKVPLPWRSTRLRLGSVGGSAKVTRQVGDGDGSPRSPPSPTGPAQRRGPRRAGDSTGSVDRPPLPLSGACSTSFAEERERDIARLLPAPHGKGKQRYSLKEETPTSGGATFSLLEPAKALQPDARK